MEVLNDDAWEPDEDFFVKVSFPSHLGSNKNYKFGDKKIMKITTLNDDEPGTRHERDSFNRYEMKSLKSKKQMMKFAL